MEALPLRAEEDPPGQDAAAVVATAAAPVAAGAASAPAAGEHSDRIDSVRALAALGVLFGHVFAFSLAFKGLTDGYKNRLLLGGGVGVYLFFTLSGYLLFLPFAKATFYGGGRLSLGRYARNRALRIVPLFYVVMGVLLLLRPRDADLGDWWRWALFIQNYSPETATKLDSPAWSLAVEMQFYVLLPALAFLAARLSRGRAAAGAALIGVLGLASWALREDRVLDGTGGDPLSPLIGPYALPSTFYLFAAGMLLALLKLHADQRGLRLPGPLGSSSAWLAAAAVGYLATCVDYAYQEPGIALVSVMLIGACVLPLRPGRGLRLLEWKPLALVGVASYSLYLLHVPLLETLTGTYGLVLEQERDVQIIGEPTDFKVLLGVALPLSLALAALSYRFVERPFLGLRRRWAR